MKKNEPIIFKICNFEEVNKKFIIPYRKELCKNAEFFDIRFDVKINSKWHKNILPDELELDVAPKQSFTILIKPHNDLYFAGWGRWFNWNCNDWLMHTLFPKPLSPEEKRRRRIDIKRRGMLTAVLSDPDYAHLESETKIGENFRAHQYSGCKNLELVPHEDLDGEFEEIGKGFRSSQYSSCCFVFEINAMPIEKTPVGVKKIGKSYRRGQYYNDSLRNTPERVLPEFVNPNQKDADKFLRLLLENNCWILQHIPECMKTEDIYKFAIEKDLSALKYIPDYLKTEELCKAAIEKNSSVFSSLKYIPDCLKTEELCKAELEKQSCLLEFVPERYITEELCEMLVAREGSVLKYVPEKFITKELCEIAVIDDPYALKHVPESLMTEELCKAALEKNAYLLANVPEKFITKELCEIAVIYNPYLLANVPEKLRTKELCEIAVIDNPYALKHVPESLKTEELYRIAIRNGRGILCVPKRYIEELREEWRAQKENSEISAKIAEIELRRENLLLHPLTKPSQK